MQEESVLKAIRNLLHELAQPLSAITGMVDLLLLESDENSPIFQELGMVNDQLQQALEIVAEIRRLTREASTRPSSSPISPA